MEPLPGHRSGCRGSALLWGKTMTFLSNTRGGTDARRRRGPALVAVVMTALLVALLPAMPASAANQSVLDVEITAVDHATGQPQTTAARGEHGNRVAYRVDFSC